MRDQLEAARASEAAVIAQLRKEEAARRKLNAQILELKGNIRVFVRTRPLLAGEEEDPAKVEYPDLADLDGGKKMIVEGPKQQTATGKDRIEKHNYEFDRVFNVNVRSIFLSVHAIVPVMKKQGGGSIINISSTGSIRPRPGLVWYNSSKGAVTNATLGLAAEFGPDQIRINAIAPLLSGTGLFSTFVGMEDTPENRR